MPLNCIQTEQSAESSDGTVNCHVSVLHFSMLTKNWP